MQPTETGEKFMKQVIKAALSALFAIGVTSSSNIDKFIEHFSEELMKNYPDVPSESITEAKVDTTTPQDASQDSKKEEVDVSTLVKNEEIVKILRAEGIDTINQLILTMNKKSLTEINGIDGVTEDSIREAMKEYNKK